MSEATAPSWAKLTGFEVLWLWSLSIALMTVLSPMQYPMRHPVMA